MRNLFTTDLLAFMTVVVLLLALGLFCIVLFRFFKKRGGFKLVMLGATDAFYNKDHKKAIEVVVNKDAGKKLEEQNSGDPELK